jgi:hypothetical protein
MPAVLAYCSIRFWMPRTDIGLPLQRPFDTRKTLFVLEPGLILPRFSGHIEKPQVNRGMIGGCVHETEPKEIRYSI